ncbi:MAG: type II secretion system F family protein [Deltaproteobacteria bacterium]|nr:type II secretion system F family protein [Deltaproteobacteria bacterium]
MSYLLQKTLIYCLIFVSVSFFIWAASRLFMDGFEVYGKSYMNRASKALNEMYIFQDARKIFLFNMAITGFFFLIGLIVSQRFFAGVLFGVFGFFTPRFFISYLRKKRYQQFEAQLVDGLLVLSNALRSGMNLVQAIETLEQEMEAPISQEFGLVIRENRLGVNIEEALENLAKRVPSEDLSLLVTSINIVHGMGGNLMEIFDSMAEVIRERNKLKGKTDALTSQGKLQGIIVGLMPTVIGVIMYFMDPTAMQRMFTSAIGIVSIGVMLGLQITGFFILKKITTIRV